MYGINKQQFEFEEEKYFKRVKYKINEEIKFKKIKYLKNKTTKNYI